MLKKIAAGSFWRMVICIIAFSALPSLAVVLYAGYERSEKTIVREEHAAITGLQSILQLQHSTEETARMLLGTLTRLAYLQSDAAIAASCKTLQKAFPTLAHVAFIDAQNVIHRSGDAQEDIPLIASGLALARRAEGFQAGGMTRATPQSEPVLHFFHTTKHDEGYYTFAIGIKLGAKIQLFRESLSFQEMIVAIGDRYGSRLLYLQTQEKDEILFFPPGESPPADAESLLDALSSQSEEAGFFYHSAGGKRFFAAFDAKRLEHAPGKQKPYATAMLALPDAPLLASVARTRATNLSLFITALAAMAVVAGLLTLYFFHQPLMQLLTLAKGYARGEYAPKPWRFPVKEFAALANAMKHMAQNIEKKEGALVTARSEAEEAAKYKEMFIANMSHEIRTPMNAVIGMAYLALKEEMTDKQRIYLKKIHESGRTLLAVVNDILELSKLNAGKVGMESIPFSVRDVFADNQRLFRSAAREKGLELTFDIAPNVPRRLVGDPGRLGQLIGHLTDNAIRYTQRGSVTLSCSMEKEEQSRASLRFSVADTGSGVAPPKLAAIGRMLESDELYLTGGVNELGLEMVHRLAAALGGRLAIENVPGRGATFSFFAAFGIRDTARTPTGKPFADKHAIAIDDDPVTLTLIKDLLNGFGLQCATETDPQNAIVRIAEADEEGAPYDLAIIDWRMPGLDGVETTRRIKKDMPLASPPKVIMLSAYGWSGITLQAEDAGVDIFLHKPLNESILFDTLLSLLPPTWSDAEEAPPPEDDTYDAQNTIERLRGLHILVVEDNDVNRNIAGEMLTKAGARATFAEDGQKALEFFASPMKAAPFSAVLMDMRMPGMDGYETARRIRALPSEWAAHIPLIAMTAQNKDGDAWQECGLDDYINKPIEAEEVFAALEKWPLLKALAGEDAEACFSALQKSVSSWAKDAADLITDKWETLSPLLGEGRMQKLQRLVSEGKYEEACAFLTYINAVISKTRRPQVPRTQSAHPVPGKDSQA